MKIYYYNCKLKKLIETYYKININKYFKNIKNIGETQMNFLNKNVN